MFNYYYYQLNWISPSDVCLPIDKGGLDLKMMEDFNKALYFKWKWRILEDLNSIWVRMLKAQYVDIKLRTVNGGTKFVNKQSCSVWWMDICSLGNKNS